MQTLANNIFQILNHCESAGSLKGRCPHWGISLLPLVWKESEWQSQTLSPPLDAFSVSIRKTDEAVWAVDAFLLYFPWHLATEKDNKNSAQLFGSVDKNWKAECCNIHDYKVIISYYNLILFVLRPRFEWWKELSLCTKGKVYNSSWIGSDKCRGSDVS